MSKLQFQLEFLDGLVPTLQSMAGEHEDMSASLKGHASSAQSLGADGWIVDQVRYASSLLGSNPDLFRQLSSELGSRLELAHQAADLSSGGPTALRAELTLAMTATVGLLKAASGSTKANQRVQVGAKKSPAKAGAAALLSPTRGGALVVSGSLSAVANGNSISDCVQYTASVMERIGIEKRPGQNGNIYTHDGWSACGFTLVAARNLPSGGGQTSAVVATRLNSSAPPPGSFFEMGQDDANPNSQLHHHAGIYLGSKDGYAYVAQANWDGKGSPPEVYKVSTDGTNTTLGSSETAALSKATLTSDPNAAQALLNLWQQHGPSGLTSSDLVIQFYSAPAK
jgi:hypothetical protein